MRPGEEKKPSTHRLIVLARSACAAALVALLAACGSLPQPRERPPSNAAAVDPNAALAKIAAASTPPGDELSGFRLMPPGFYSLDARIELAKRAPHSLDMQYYQITQRPTGRLLLRKCATRRCAACACGCSSTTSTRSAATSSSSALAAFPNVEVRLFNPFCCGRGGCSRSTRPRCPTSRGSTTACTTSCSSPTARSPSPAAQHRRRILHAQHDATTSSTWTR